MKFGNPIVLNWLWLAPLVAAFFWFTWRQRRRALELFAAPHLLPVIAPTLNERLGLLRAILVTAAIILLVLSVALPRWGYHWQEVKRRGIDIFVALDVSKSMLAQDVRPNRLEQAKFAVRDLLKLAGGDRVGLVAFAGTAFVSCPLTLDHSAVQLMLDDTTPDIIPLGGTDIAGAIKEAIRGFSHAADRNRALIIITDGEATEGDAVSAAKTAAKLGIRIFTIGIGTASGELIPVPAEGGSREFLKDRQGRVVQTKLDDATLQQIALTANGYYVHAAAGNFGLDTIYKNGIEPMAPKDFETKLEQQFEEQFQWPLGLALALLMAEALLRERRKETRGFVSPVAKSSAKATILIGSLFFSSHLSAAATTEITDPPPSLYNEGNAIYRKREFDAAAKAYQGTLVTQDKELQQRAFYNLGNACYRQASPAETADPKRAQELFKQAVTCYDSALALNPKDPDAAFNKKLAELRLKKLEEQQKQQQQQNQQQQQKQQQQQQQASLQQKQQKPDDKSKEQQQQAQQMQQQQQKQQQSPQQQPGEQPKPEKKPGEDGQPNEPREMSEREAKLLLDEARDEEKQWKERKPLRHAGEREPDKNW